jgi:hypothetical protein
MTMQAGDKGRLITELLDFLAGESGEQWEQARQVLRFLPRREFESDREAPVAPGCLVELQWLDAPASGLPLRVLILPQAGGWVARTSLGPVQVLTPQSPLGEKVLGATVGSELEVPLSSGGTRRYRVLAFS